MTTNRRAFLQSAGALLAGAGLARSVSAMPTERPEKFDESFDVVVLGAGGAGLTAAIRLAEGGKKVLLAEKASSPPGLRDPTNGRSSRSATSGCIRKPS